MKKLKLFVTMMLITLAMTCICVVGVSAGTAFAEETATETTTEVTTETEVVEGMTEKDLSEYWESFKQKISDSATWTSIGAGVLTIISTSGVIGYSFKKIIALLLNKADKESVKKEISDLKEHIMSEYNTNNKMIAERLERTENNEEKFFAILSVFMLNCKIPDCAKAEIMALLTDIKKHSGDISEIVEKAQEAIENAQNEKMSLEPPAPELEKLLEEEKESNAEMKLG